MSSYSSAKAKDNLLKLIDEALAGEEVTITRRGKPVVELRPARSARDVCRQSRSTGSPRAPSRGEDAVDIIRRMRDDYP